MPLDPNIAVLLQFIEAAGYPQVAESTPEVARQGLRTLLVDMRDESAIVPVSSVTEATVGDGTPVRVYRPEDDTNVPTIVFLHGGGFVIGDLDTHDNICRMLCRDTGSVVVSVDYPLAPEQPFPAAVDASYAALQHVAKHIDQYGGDASRIAVGGDSAGGNLAAVCAQQALRDDLPLVAQLLVYPSVSLLGDYPSRTENGTGYFITLADMEWFAAHYTGIEGGAESAAADPDAVALAQDVRLSPILADSLAGLPPAVLVTAEFDPLRDEGNAYADALRHAGVQVEHQQFDGLIHGFYGLEAISPAIAEATRWTNNQLKVLLGL